MGMAATTTSTQRASEPTANGSIAEKWLRDYLGQVRAQRDRLKAIERRWSWARLTTFFAAASIWYPLSASPSIAVGASAVCAALFVVAVMLDRRTAERRELADGLVLVAEEACRRAGGNVVLIRSCQRPAQSTHATLATAPILDDGPTWALTGQECDDLDFYSGPVGIFGLLNRTSTGAGAARLSELMEHPCLSADHIRARQAAVRCLCDHAAERLRIMAAVTRLRGKDEWLTAFARAVHGATPIARRGTSVALRIWSLITAAYLAFAIVAWWSYGVNEWIAWALWLVLINPFLFYRVRSDVSPRVRAWRDTTAVAKAYLRIAREAVADLPTDPQLDRLRACFAAVIVPDALPRLYKSVAWADTEGPMHAFFNALFFYDVHVAEAILKRAVPHRDALLAGLAALRDFEALASLACFAHEQPVRCWPELAAAPVLTIRGGRHPLIAPDRAVANDVELTPRVHVWVITGSNMAGKSTFLRMLGLNALLAQWGTTVVAEHMSFAPTRLISDLQVRDNLSSAESYFLAEVRHLRRMVCPPPGEAPVLGLMDEPFRGTNSLEKVAASAAVVRQVMGSAGFFAVATHELRLTRLAADGSPAANYHFREDLASDGLIFDYVLRPGPAPTRNALRVLERENYPAGVLEVARQWMRQTAEGTIDTRGSPGQ